MKIDEGQHLPLDYRPAGEPRWTVPADVCDTCSDFPQGQLVPVSFCPTASLRTQELYDFLNGGPRPDWA